MTNNITEALHRTQQAIAQNQQKLGVQPNAKLIAVSKTKPVEAVSMAYQAGQRAFGENYVQELVVKAQALRHYADIEWHFIGPLQSNKTRDVAQYASWVHSVDRLKIAERLSAQRPKELPPLRLLLQINISEETSKAGIAPEELLPLASAIAALPQIELKGLMAIPEPGQSQPAFVRMQALSHQLQKEFPNATELSMGMSDDWQEALASGATMVRLGTAIFGARDYKTQ